MPDWVPININLLKHPLNWFVVFFMVVIPMIAFVIVQERIMGDEADK